MFDIGLSELILIAVVAFVVLGPEEMVHTLHRLGRLVGRAQRWAYHSTREWRDMTGILSQTDDPPPPSPKPIEPPAHEKRHDG